MTQQKALAKKLERAKRGHAFARHTTWSVLALLGGAVLTLAIHDGWTPVRGRLFMMLWGNLHAMDFYPVLAAVLLAPLLSLIAWRARGIHRCMLASSWALFITVTAVYYPHRVQAMCYDIWFRYGEGVAASVAQVM